MPDAPRPPKADVWLPFYVAEHISKTTHLSSGEQGGYLMLICHAWMNAGVIPTDDETMRIITRMLPREWKLSKAKLLDFFYKSDAGYRNAMVDRELTKANRNILNASIAGKNSARVRWGNRPAKTVTAVTPTASPPLPVEHPEQHNGGDAVQDASLLSYLTTSSLIDKSKNSKEESLCTAKAAPTTRGHRLPEDWQPDQKLRAYAVSLGRDPVVEAERFRNHYHSAPGRRGLQLRWDLTFKKWCSNDYGKSKPASKSENGWVTAGNEYQPLSSITKELTNE